MDSAAFCRSLWNLPACFARHNYLPNKINLEINWYFARACLVCAASDSDSLIRGRSRTRVQKDAEPSLVAVTSRLDLDSACRVTRWRGPFR